jgi:hypothetical protein
VNWRIGGVATAAASGSRARFGLLAAEVPVSIPPTKGYKEPDEDFSF